MFSKVGRDDDGGIILILILAVIIITLIIYAAYFLSIIGCVAGGGYSIFNYGKSFKKNIIDENFSSIR